MAFRKFLTLFGIEDTNALLKAAKTGDLQGMNTLLEAGENIETQNTKGKTALMIAASKGHIDIVDLLLLHGANKESKDKNGHTAMTYARKNRHNNVLELIQHFKMSFNNRLRKIHYTDEIPILLQCPISLSLMDDPITVSSGITYDRESLKSVFASRGNPECVPCPITRLMIAKFELENRTAVTIKTLAEEFVVEKEKEAAENKKIRQMHGPVTNQM